MFNNPLFWQAAAFSGAAILFVAHSVWWFYLSRLDTEPARTAPPSPRVAAWLAGLLGLSAAQLTVGALWDASMHIQTGQIPAGADFLWPPHIMIYSSFFLSFLVALARRLTGYRWAATATAGLFYLFRLAVTLGLDLTGNVAPTVPLVFILGALLLDAVPWQRVKSGILRYLGWAAAYTAGYTALALPLLAFRAGLDSLSPFDYFMTVTMTLLVSLALMPVAQLAARRLAPERQF